MVDGTSARDFSDAEAFERRDDDEAAPAARDIWEVLRADG